MHLLTATLHLMFRQLCGHQVRCFSFKCFYDSEKNLFTPLELSANMLIDVHWLLGSFSYSFFDCTDPNHNICCALGDLQIKILLTLFVKPILL